MARPTSEVRDGLCGICPAGCWLRITLEDGRIARVEPDPDHPLGMICTIGRHAPQIVYDPDRLAADDRGVVGGVLRGGLALQVPGRPGEERRVVDGARDVELPGQPDGLAGLPGLGQRQRLGPLLQQARPPVHERAPLGRGRGAPPGERTPCSGDRSVDLAGTAEVDVGHMLTGGRVAQGDLLPVGPTHVAVDELAPGVLGHC